MADIEYKIERSRRRSYAVYVADGKVTVKAPYKADIKTIEKFFVSKQSWVIKKLSDYQRRTQRFADVFLFERFIYEGERLEFAPNAKKRFKIDGGKLYVPQEFFEDGKIIASERFKTSLIRFCRKTASERLLNRLNEISYALKLKFAGFSLTNAKTKWGSCDSKNNIRLNWRLILLKRELIDYVIVHELMHTVEHNHSNRFWSKVNAVYPDYKEAVKCLKEDGILIKYPQ